MKKLKIAQIAPLWYPVPPTGYGGVELVITLITEQLVQNGHDVYLYASSDSKTKGKLVSFFESPRNVWGHHATEALLHIKKSFDHVYSLKPDIIHSHLGADQFALFFDTHAAPSVYTAHNEILETVAHNFKKNNIVSISKYHKNSIKGFDHYFTVYNGIDLKNFKDLPADNYLSFLGRIDPFKNPGDAVKVAQKTGLRLKIAGKLYERQKGYFDKEIAPGLSGSIEFIGEIGSEKKSTFLGNSRVLLAPIAWEEPFGLYLVEALAVGTPVIAFAKGAVPELIKDGETGFIVNFSETDRRGNWITKSSGLQGMVEAVNQIYKMPEVEYRSMRRACRRHVEENFTVPLMTKGYEQVYETILNSK